MDVIIPYSQEAKWNDNELRYCIRSLCQNLKELNNIYIVGYKPEWLEKVIHIPFEDTWKKNKDANIIAKILKVCEVKELSEDFLFISDDQIILQSLKGEEIKPLWWEDLHLRNWAKRNRWVERLERTYKKLRSEGKTTLNFDSHIPVVFNKNKFIQIMGKYDWHIDGQGYTINTLYFNNIDEEKIKINGEKAVFENKVESKDKIKELIKGKLYLGWNDIGLNEYLKQVIGEVFENKCVFEK